ncbi:hypothetical protein K435DRAFT_742431 [Dendrothele bispora CBS 962.96]|uniref:Methyltransferase domain-containing protein n=1 Tax=Dendrothele bispora (strain CBS 962.96) TaxID=1314807 RepID=A0A4S8MXX8_DENBC|nr:hypothetical protein K435DRAFT_742431 [Dendrothele bispora CBS 962.96]
MSSAQKDVEALLLKERFFRRRPGEVPYPLKDYDHSGMLDYDTWDHLFFKSCFRSLTIHEFDTPPSMVLDLGCGTGLWALEATMEWPSSKIIGFDLKDNQLKVGKSDIYSDLVGRLQWKQGNFLDSLPFPTDTFDFVRISRLGLAIPEDEWQFVLEEVHRVMKSGAVLEIIEEDLIFPYCQSARPRPERPRPSPLNVDLPIPDPINSGTLSSRSSLNTISSSTVWSSLDDQPDSALSKKSGLTPLQESPQSIFPPSRFSPKSPLSIKSQATFPSRGQTPTHLSYPTPAPPQQPPAAPLYNSCQSHPQDHSKLKAAWDAMLSNRWLAPRLITVLPFYLSSCFVNVRSHPSLQIPLPPNSSSSEQSSRTGSLDFDPSQQFELQRTTETGGRRSDSDETIPQDLQNDSHKRLLLWAPMHLARMVNTIQACKEAIYMEYDKLHSPELPPVAVKDGRLLVKKHAAREAFEREWSNWENDMADRIGMRDHVMSQFQWPEPLGERPDWRVWRNNLKLLENTQDAGDLCRTLRGFVAQKP